MFLYFLAFLLINSYYQSLGVPVQTKLLISESLSALATQCENEFLSSAIRGKIKDCAVYVPPYHKKQIQCLIFYDMNRQLCSAVAASKLGLTSDFGSQINQTQDVATLCINAKDWIFSNITEYVNYKNVTEHFFRLPATCGEICGADEIMNEANDFCKYFKFGADILKTQVPTTANNGNNNAGDAPVIPEPESNPKADIAVPVNGDQVTPMRNTKTQNVQIKQTESVGNKTAAEETLESAPALSKSIVQVTSKQQTANENTQPTNIRKEDDDLNIEGFEHPIEVPEVDAQPQVNKPTVSNNSKLDQNDPALLPETGKDNPPNIDPKEVVLEKAEGGKPPSDPDDYTDSEGNEPADDDGDDQGLDIRARPEAKHDFVRTKLVSSHNADLSQKEYYPNPMTDTFSEDGDHFFPFFLTAVILVVVLYVLYHNKNKVGKVFFGLLLEGRQGSRRRNSRGHAYRRLDTLEQAMSANTAAPPSKIIY